MSLLAQVNQPNVNGYYFALVSTPGEPVITAQAFDAVGTGTPANGGSFTANAQDLTGAGQDAFVMAAAGGVARWAMGMDGVEGGANSGSNMAMFAYADDGSFLSAPLEIIRATGGVVMPVGLNTAQAVVSGLTSTESLIVGAATDVGGGVAEINGTLGLSRVYDPIYNPPVTGNDALLFTASVDGVTGGSSTPFVCAQSGLYIVSLTLQAYASGFSWTPGTTALLYGLTYNGGSNIEAGAQLYCPLITNPSGMPAIGPIGPNVVEYQNDILVNLTAGRTYVIAPASTGTPNLGVGGNVGVLVQPMFA